MITKARLTDNDPDEFLNEDAFFNFPIGLNPADISDGYKPESKPTPSTKAVNKDRMFVFVKSSRFKRYPIIFSR